MRKYFLRVALLLMGLCLVVVQPVHAQVEVLKTWVDYTFGKQVIFHLDMSSDQPIEHAVIFFGSTSDTHTNVGQVTIVATGVDSYKFTYVHKLEDYPLQPFSRIEYHYEITLSGGDVQQTQEQSFDYTDNLHTWQYLQQGSIRAYWYTGEVPFGQEILNIAQKGIERIQSLLPLPTLTSLDIYSYPDLNTLQDALSSESPDWVAGHADPELGVILLALPPGPEQRLLMEERIPHEIMHILLYQAIKPGYGKLPDWLNEGLASMAELYPNPVYRVVLESAARDNQLLRITSLCTAFPVDSTQALLAYAKAASFTRYLHSRYGASGIQDLMTTYVNGVECNRAEEVALGTNLERLDARWQRDELSQNPIRSIFNNLLPWLVILLAVMAAPICLWLIRLQGQRYEKSNAGITPSSALDSEGSEADDDR